MSEDLTHDHSSQDTFVVPLQYRPARCAEVLDLDMGDGLILYNHDGDLVHHLNASAGIIWRLCDGSASVLRLGTDIAETYALDVDEVAAQVATVVAEFEALGLVEDARVATVERR